tara:strand:- start:46 stop:1224 length:1179 start_codon:yes stop_codon:yes gene_type:complete
MNTKQAKQRFGIIGKSKDLDQALDIAIQVASTDISVLIIGESGTGKENIPKIIHQNSKRKHNPYIAINCGAIPEGTIDSELFGHEKGSFTGAHDNRKGYFETANDGTIFLDEIGELPMSSQARLLRVLESGEFIKVGSSKAQKTNVRIIAATNVNIQEAVKKNKFREDLYYRLSTVNIKMPPLRKRGNDILLLFTKFAADFSEKYNTPPIQMTEEAKLILMKYSWPGNIRQLMNFVMQLSVIEKERLIDAETMKKLIPIEINNTPILFNKEEKNDFSERELLYKVLFDMKRDLNELKKVTYGLINENENNNSVHNIQQPIISHKEKVDNLVIEESFNEDEKLSNEISLSLFDQEKKLIQKSLNKHNGKRKKAAEELGISERTLYRKIKEFGL